MEDRALVNALGELIITVDKMRGKHKNGKSLSFSSVLPIAVLH